MWRPPSDASLNDFGSGFFAHSSIGESLSTLSQYGRKFHIFFTSFCVLLFLHWFVLIIFPFLCHFFTLFHIIFCIVKRLRTWFLGSALQIFVCLFGWLVDLFVFGRLVMVGWLVGRLMVQSIT